MRLFLTCLLLALPVLGAEVPPLLQEVADRWVNERQRWAFTQLVREWDGDGEVLERLERYDPARGESRRWELLRLNGQAATPREAEEWSKRKNRVRKHPPKAVAEYVDLEHARLQHEDAHSVSYDVPLRRVAGGLFPGDKVAVVLTINKHSHEIERAQARIDGPFNVALGLARIIDLDLDLAVRPDAEPANPALPGPEKTQGTASAVVNKLGRRVEYYWSDFTRAAPPSESPAH